MSKAINGTNPDYRMIRTGKDEVAVNLDECDLSMLDDLELVLQVAINEMELKLADSKQRYLTNGEPVDRVWVQSCKNALGVKKLQKQLINRKRGELRASQKKTNAEIRNEWHENYKYKVDLIFTLASQYLTPEEIKELKETYRARLISDQHK